MTESNVFCLTVKEDSADEIIFESDSKIIYRSFSGGTQQEHFRQGEHHDLWL